MKARYAALAAALIASPAAAQDMSSKTCPPVIRQGEMLIFQVTPDGMQPVHAGTINRVYDFAALTVCDSFTANPETVTKINLSRKCYDATTGESADPDVVVTLKNSGHDVSMHIDPDALRENVLKLIADCKSLNPSNFTPS